MSNEIIVPFNETLLRLPSCLALHAQLRSNLIKFTSEDYLQFTRQLHVCGIVRKTTESETIVVALAAYRYHLSTYDTVRFEIDDLIVDEKERNHGLGTQILHYLIDQAKQHNVLQILIHCDPTNTNAHRLFFRFGLTIFVFEFALQNFQLLPVNDQIHLIDITDLPEKENEQLLIQVHDIFRQLRPHLPTDQQTYIKQIRDICRTGPARMIVAISNDEKKNILGLSLYRITRNINYSKHIYCDDLVTDENNRSSGVGRCLINYMKNEGEKLGMDRLVLDSGCQRGRAHRFYYREGFVISQFGFMIHSKCNCHIFTVHDNALHAQLRSNLIKFTSEDYLQFTQQLHICGIVRKTTESETIVVALAAYRYHLSTYGTVRFEIDDLIVDEKERNHGLGTQILHYLIDQAKQHNVLQILIHCDPTNTNAHRLFFRFGLIIFVFEFALQNFQLLPVNDQIRLIDITDLPEKENEQLLIQVHDIYRQLGPHLPTDQQTYIKQIRDICRTGPARMIVAISNDEKKNILGLSLYRITRNINYSKHIYCDDLVTDENNRSSGVGRSLNNYMKNEGEKLGMDRLVLDSGCQRGRAHRFYYREGFVISQFGFMMSI